MIRQPPEGAGADGRPLLDPMADIASIVDEVVRAGFDQRRFTFASVHMRFIDRGQWEHATKAAKASWEVAAYSTEQGHMLRLSRRAHPSLRDLVKLRADALAFARTNEADWLSVSIEDLQQMPTPWQTLAAPNEIKLPEQHISPEIENDPEIGDGIEWQRLQRGGTA